MISFFMIFPFFIGNAEVLWQQNWDTAPDWQTPVNEMKVGIRDTHDEAIQFNCSDYRTSGPSYVDFEITSEGCRGGTGKCIAYHMHGNSNWSGGHIGLVFSDPDIKWTTPDIDKTGYEELYYRVWMRSPNLNFSGSGTRLWKAARFYCYDPNKYDWKYLFNTNTGIGSHWIGNEEYYKKPFFIPSWAGYPHWYPQYHTEADTTTAYTYDHDADTAVKLIQDFLSDGEWHCFEYHVKLNDIGSNNSIQEVYVDGVLRSTAGNNHVMRNTPLKIQMISLFDNYAKPISSGDQTLYLDDMVISTTYIGLESQIKKVVLVNVSVDD